MNGVDLRRFDFDFDTTWAAFFLDPELNIYSRYGGRDEREPADRLSKESLLSTMDEVLKTHRQLRGAPGAAYRQQLDQRFRKNVIQIDDPPDRPEDIPLLKQSHQGCIHCHQVQEYRLLQAASDQTFNRKMLFQWPLPESIGIQLDPKDGVTISEIEPKSAAAAGNLKPGDAISFANGFPVRSEFDLRWVLARHTADDKLALEVQRGGSISLIKLGIPLSKNGTWRETELGWRKSLRSVPVEFGFRGYALTRSPRKPLGIGPDALAIKIVAVRDIGLAKSLQIQKGDVVVALGDQSENREIDQLFSDILRQSTPGSAVTMSVMRDGERITLTGVLPDWHTEETSVP